jgi:hypothetical protein
MGTIIDDIRGRIETTQEYKDMLKRQNEWRNCGIRSTIDYKISDDFKSITITLIPNNEDMQAFLAKLKMTDWKIES